MSGQSSRGKFSSSAFVQVRMRPSFFLGSPEQIVLCRPDQLTSTSEPALECEAAPEADRRTVTRAADQARVASNFIRDRFDAGVKCISVRIALACIVC